MIILGNKGIIKIAKGSREIAAIYKGTKLIYASIRSCFGGGAWVNEKPWSNVEPWKN